eukprot:scaffold30604_cov22-Prasinocladus_malaysianus.AAC.1
MPGAAFGQRMNVNNIGIQSWNTAAINIPAMLLSPQQILLPISRHNHRHQDDKQWHSCHSM